jgi:hypothetical protein
MLSRMLAGSGLRSLFVWCLGAIFALTGLLCLGNGVEILERGYQWFYPGLAVLSCGTVLVNVLQHIFKVSALFCLRDGSSGRCAERNGIGSAWLLCFSLGWESFYF